MARADTAATRRGGDRPNPFLRLFRGETHVDFAGRWRYWFAISGVVIVVGLLSLGIRGLNFSVDFKGGTIWQVPTTASVAQAQNAVEKVDPALSQAQIQIQTDQETHQRTIQIQAGTTESNNAKVITEVRAALATMAHTSTNDVTVQSIGASWGANITHKAVKAVIIFLVVVSIYIWLRFEGKMALAALVALLHDILVTVGIYSLSGFQVSPDTVIAFLTILGYSLYDTIVVFDKVQENTKSLASSNRQTYTAMVNISMNQVLARSLNTSFVAIIPILSILVIGAGILGATTLDDFGLALFIGLTTGAYSSIFIASPLVGLLKEREQRYREIRRRIASGAAGGAAAAAAGGGRTPPRRPSSSGGTAPLRPVRRAGSAAVTTGSAAATALSDPAPSSDEEHAESAPAPGRALDAPTSDPGVAEEAVAAPSGNGTPSTTPVPPPADQSAAAATAQEDPPAMTADLGPLRARIRDVADFPQPGVVFKDITPLLADPITFETCIEALSAPFLDLGIDKVLGVEARGFIVAAPVALRLGAGFVPLRKPGKLPWKVESEPYTLEYGDSCLEVHADAVAPGERVLIVDDVLATGGTASAAAALARRLGARSIGFACLIELAFLGGRAKLAELPVLSLLNYPAEGSS